MFTGIVEETGRVISTAPGSLIIGAKDILQDVKLGDSIDVNGVCLTVTAFDAGSFTIEAMPETLRLTSLGLLRPGSLVNLERAMPLGGRMGGHMVQGHVDDTGSIASVSPEGNALIVRIEAPPGVLRYAVTKGFIAVDGISLTIVDRDSTSFRVSLVGFTRNQTTLGDRKPGDKVNLEADIIAKYVEQFTGSEGSGVTMELLRESGFTAN